MNDEGDIVIRNLPPAQYPVMFPMKELGHRQLANKLEIPYPYYRKMGEHRHLDLLARNVNKWLQTLDKKVLVRTLDGNVRAILSSHYKIIDSSDVAFTVIKKAQEHNAIVNRIDLNNEHLYMRVMAPGFMVKITRRGTDLANKDRFFSTGYRTDNGTWQNMDDDDPNGDWVFAGFLAATSDVGLGAFDATLTMFRTTCRNLIIVSKAIHKIHRGADKSEGLVLSEATRNAKDQVFWSEVDDAMETAFNPEKFRTVVIQMNEAASQDLADPIEAVNNIVENHNLTEDNKQDMVNYLMSGGSKPATEQGTVWGLINSITRLANAHATPINDSINYEEIGGQILTHPDKVMVRVK